MVPQLHTRTVIEAKLIEELLYLLKQCWIVALDALPIVLHCSFSGSLILSERVKCCYDLLVYS